MAKGRAPNKQRVTLDVPTSDHEVIKAAAGDTPISRWIRDAALLMAQWTSDDPEDAARLAAEVAASAPEPEPEPQPVSPTCGTCPYFVPGEDADRGTCHGNPPTVLHDMSDLRAPTHTSVYPRVDADSLACHLYLPSVLAAVEEEPVEDEPIAVQIIAAQPVCEEPVEEEPVEDEPELASPAPIPDRGHNTRSKSYTHAQMVLAFMKANPGVPISTAQVHMGLDAAISHGQVHRALWHLADLGVVAQLGRGRKFSWIYRG